MWSETKSGLAEHNNLFLKREINRICISVSVTQEAVTQMTSTSFGGNPHGNTHHVNQLMVQLHQYYDIVKHEKIQTKLFTW